MVTTYPWIRKRPGWETDLTNQQLAMQPSKVAWPLTDLSSVDRINSKACH